MRRSIPRLSEQVGEGTWPSASASLNLPPGLLYGGQRSARVAQLYLSFAFSGGGG